MSNNETTTEDKPDHMASCAEALWEIAHSLEQIADILESCRSGRLTFGDDRHAIYTIPLTDSNFVASPRRERKTQHRW
jgi:hypothetical protein